MQLILQLLQQIEDAAGHQLIERRRDFVANNQFRLRRQRAGDADALFFAAGKLVREAVDKIVGDLDLL